MLKAIQRRFLYLLLAALAMLTLLGTPTAPSVYAGDCPSATGSVCP